MKGYDFEKTFSKLNKIQSSKQNAVLWRFSTFNAFSYKWIDTQLEITNHILRGSLWICLYVSYMYLYCKAKGNILHFSFRKKIEFKIYCFLTVGRGSKIILFLQSEAKEGFWKILGIHQTDGLASSSKIFSHFANSQIQIIFTICFLQEKVWTVQIKLMSQPANA